MQKKDRSLLVGFGNFTVLVWVLMYSIHSSVTLIEHL